MKVRNIFFISLVLGLILTNFLSYLGDASYGGPTEGYTEYCEGHTSGFPIKGTSEFGACAPAFPNIWQARVLNFVIWTLVSFFILRIFSKNYKLKAKN